MRPSSCCLDSSTVTAVSISADSSNLSTSPATRVKSSPEYPMSGSPGCGVYDPSSIPPVWRISCTGHAPGDLSNSTPASPSLSLPPSLLPVVGTCVAPLPHTALTARARTPPVASAPVLAPAATPGELRSESSINPLPAPFPPPERAARGKSTWGPPSRLTPSTVTTLGTGRAPSGTWPMTKATASSCFLRVDLPLPLTAPLAAATPPEPLPPPSHRRVRWTLC